MNCICCGKELSGGLDTYGDQHYPMCWLCWSALEWVDGRTMIFGRNLPQFEDLDIEGNCCVEFQKVSYWDLYERVFYKGLVQKEDDYETSF